MSLLLLSLGIVGVVGLVFTFYVFSEGSIQNAVEKTTNRAVGLITGAAATFMAVLVIGLEAVLMSPEIVIAALGIGAIYAGFSWEVFAATAFVTVLLGQIVGGR